MEKSGKDNKKSKKLLYIAPAVESEDIFEQNALACGKCRAASHRQHACMRLCSTS